MSEEYQLIGINNRQPKNPNELLENKFLVTIRKLPETTFKCNSANIPGISLPYAMQNTTQNPIPQPGLNVVYEPFTMTFIVDEDLNNYRELETWVRKLGMPVNNLGYSDLKLRGIGPPPDRGIRSDIVLTILTNEFKPNILVFFRDCFPISLSPIPFTNDTENPGVRVCTAQFIYIAFEISTTESEDDGHSSP